ncbi:hypothetical protein [Streptomyces sp. NPDC048516]
MADSAEIVEPTFPTPGAAGPGGSVIMDWPVTLVESLLRPRGMEVD